MLLLIDNFDSFTYNIADYFGQLGVKLKVVRNNAMTITSVQSIKPDYIVISPGPGCPDEAGISLDIIDTFAGKVPLLGVCLGHQCIGQYFGGNILRAKNLMHGKTSLVYHNEQDVFARMPSPFRATRYHSLIIERETLPECLMIIGETRDQEIMAIKHKTLPVWGVQFHPEAIATEEGIKIFDNFIRAA